MDFDHETDIRCIAVLTVACCLNAHEEDQETLAQAVRYITDRIGVTTYEIMNYVDSTRKEKRK